jgi:cytochrome bd ubiquinol oxidase subunit II
MAEIPILLILAGLALYTVLGGADFGAGLWELTARGERNTALRDHTHRAMAPVWEANHVWLIFALTMCWTCYPEAFTSIASTLSIPLFVAAVGIIMRGAAYALRAGVISVREEGSISLLFALSSLLTPFALGTVVGGVASGRVPVGNAAGDEIASWLNATSLLIGTLAVVTSAYLAAVYLAGDARRMGSDDVADAFRRRALGAGLLAGAIAAAGPFVLDADAPELFEGLTGGAGLVALLASAAAGVAALALVYGRRYEPARVAAAAAVVAVVAGWGIAQQPEILPGLTIEEAAADDATIAAVLIGFVAGMLILLPSLGYLFRLVLTGRFDPAVPLPSGDGTDRSPPVESARETGTVEAPGNPAKSLRPTLAAGAVTALGAVVTFLSDAPLRSVAVAVMLAGAIACFVALAGLDETEPTA